MDPVWHYKINFQTHLEFVKTIGDEVEEEEEEVRATLLESSLSVTEPDWTRCKAAGALTLNSKSGMAWTTPWSTWSPRSTVCFFSQRAGFNNKNTQNQLARY